MGEILLGKNLIVHGSFDILHSGHKASLAERIAHVREENGLKEVRILLDSDQRISKAKGEERPLFDFGMRSADLIEYLSDLDVPFDIHEYNSNSYLLRHWPYYFSKNSIVSMGNEHIAKRSVQQLQKLHPNGVYFYDSSDPQHTTSYFEELRLKEKQAQEGLPMVLLGEDYGLNGEIDSWAQARSVLSEGLMAKAGEIIAAKYRLLLPRAPKIEEAFEIAELKTSGINIDRVVYIEPLPEADRAYVNQIFKEVDIRHRRSGVEP